MHLVVYETRLMSDQMVKVKLKVLLERMNEKHRRNRQEA